MFKNNTPGNPGKMNDGSAEKLNRIVDGSHIEGEIVSDSNIRIDGTVTGNIRVAGRLVVGATGKVKGEIMCENAEVEGTVLGKIHVNGLLSLKASARLEGDIFTNKLAIEPGAVFSGACSMGAKIKDIVSDGGTSKRPDVARQEKTA